MPLFDNVKPEEFLLFVKNFKMPLDASGMLSANLNIQYICTQLRGYSLPQFDHFCAQVGSTTMAYFNQVILVLGTQFFL